MSTVKIYIPLDFKGIVKKPKYYGGLTLQQIMVYIGAIALGVDALVYLKNFLFTNLSIDTFLKDFWFDDLIFIGEVSFLIAIKPYLSNSPLAWYKSFIYFDGDTFMINRTGFKRSKISLKNIIKFDVSEGNSVTKYLVFTHKNGEEMNLPWLSNTEIRKEDQNTIQGLFKVIQNRIDQNLLNIDERDIQLKSHKNI